MSIAEIAVYNKPDREKMLYEGAKKEGKLMWYTSLAGGSYKELVKLFETKYPGIQIDAFRAGGSDLATAHRDRPSGGRGGPASDRG